MCGWCERRSGRKERRKEGSKVARRYCSVQRQHAQGCWGMRKESLVFGLHNLAYPAPTSENADLKRAKRNEIVVDEIITRLGILICPLPGV